jgi:transcriptional regulator with PAS, ATPase and Fis domain
VPGFSPAALNALSDYPWPGNVRALENEIERAVTLVLDGQVIEPEHLSERLTMKKPVLIPLGAPATSLRRARASFDEQYITEILRQNNGNASKAAKVLGISRVMLQKKIKEFGLRAKVSGAHR